VLGDVDRDGVLEIVCGGLYNDSRQYIVRHDGTVMSGWPQFFQTNIEGTAVIANVDSSPTMEVLNGDNFTVNADFFGFDVNGVQAPNFPLVMSGSMSVNSAAVGDVDRNGTMEIALVNGDGTVNLWATGEPFDSTRAEWPTFNHDNCRTNNYHFRSETATEVSRPRAALLPGGTRLFQNYPNPCNPSTTVSFETTHRGHVSLVVIDILGRTGAILLDETRDAGVHHIRFDARGMSSGTYFCTLRAGKTFSINKMLVIH
jgi:hypothetical protein